MGVEKEDEPRWKKNQRKKIAEYQKTHYKRIPLSVQMSFYEELLKPAAEAVNEPINGFIKKAIVERIEREGLFPQGYNDVPEELQPIVNDTFDYIAKTVYYYIESGRPDRKAALEEKLDSYIRGYIRSEYKDTSLTPHDIDNIVTEITKLYNQEFYTEG